MGGGVEAPQKTGMEALQALVADRLDAMIGELRRIIVSDFDRIEEVNDYLAMLRGKLFRPTLTFLANEVGSERDDRAVPLASVVELVHLATLVHDDTIDQSELRRGQPTVNALWSHQMAVLMGDYLYSRAIMQLAEVGSIEAVGVMANAANQMSVGEIRQISSYDALDFTERDYDLLIAAKTASLMSAACRVGALVGAPRFEEPLGRFGHALGMAFQIADDLLDYTASAEQTGKPVGHDLRQHKVTLPLVHALERMSPAESQVVQAFFETPEPSDEAIAEVVGIVEGNGGLAYAKSRADGFADEAYAALREVAEGPARDALWASVAYATQRTR